LDAFVTMIDSCQADPDLSGRSPLSYCATTFDKFRLTK
jgi:hypothetical protein